MNTYRIGEKLISTEKIQRRCNELVEEMIADCRGDNFVVIGILRGSFMFLADLVRDFYQHGAHPRIDFMTLESYGSGTESSGKVTIVRDFSIDVGGADVLLIDDILDSGRTLDYASRHIEERAARSVKTCTLLDKPARRVIDIRADHVGFTIEDEFVVGYGLDYDGRYRELPYIARLEEGILE